MKPAVKCHTPNHNGYNANTFNLAILQVHTVRPKPSGPTVKRPANQHTQGLKAPSNTNPPQPMDSARIAKELKATDTALAAIKSISSMLSQGKKSPINQQPQSIKPIPRAPPSFFAQAVQPAHSSIISWAATEKLSETLCNGWATTTIKSYEKAVNNFIAFCDKENVPA